LENADSITELRLQFRDATPPSDLFSNITRCSRLEEFTCFDSWGGSSNSCLRIGEFENRPPLKKLSLDNIHLLPSDLATLSRLADLNSLSFIGELSETEILDFLRRHPHCEVDMKACTFSRNDYAGRRFKLVNGKLECEKYDNRGWCGT
jgi:hypothetical protein